MSTFQKISLVRLETQFKLSIDPIRNKNKNNIYPLTPSFVKKYLDNKTYAVYMNALKTFFKIDNKQIDPRLRDYQNEDIQIMLKRKVNGLFYEQRLGKTPTTIVTIANNPNIHKTLIIAPKSTHVNWEQEIYKWHNENIKVARIRGTLKQRKNYYSNDYSYFIMTYETASIDKEIIPNVNCIVIDEAHRLRNFKGQRSKQSPTFTKNILQLSYKIPYKFALSGTPASNKSEDIYPILNFLYPDLFSSYWNFINFYYFVNQEQKVTRNGWDSVTVINGLKPNGKVYLQEFLDLTCIQRKRKDHMKWIPKVDKKLIKIPMSNIQTKYYNQLNKTWECEALGFDCQNQLVLTTRLRQIANLNEGCKQEFILNYLDDYPEEKIIVSSAFTSCLKELKEKIKTKREVLLISGETTAKSRQEIVDRFNKSTKPVILLGNIGVIKEGIKLETAETLIELDPSLTQADNQQVYDRFIPTTQEAALSKNKQQIIKLIAKNSIDEYIFECLKLKKSAAEIVNNFKSEKDVKTIS